MLSINYAKKNGDGYVISFYADTVEDITNFDPTKSFGIYGIPQKGSIITLVSGTDSVNYYLGDSGEIVEVEVGGDEPTGDLTPFQIGDQIIDNVTKVKFDTTISTEDMTALLSQLDYTVMDGSMYGCVLVGLDEGGDPMKDDNVITAIRFEFNEENVYAIYVADVDGVIFSSADVYPEPLFTAGWNMDVLNENGEVTIGNVDSNTVQYLVDTPGLNGVVYGIVEGEPTPPTPSLTPFEEGQTISGVDFGNIQNGDTSDVINSLLTGLAGQYSGDGIYTLLGRSGGSGNIIVALDLSEYGGTGYAIGVEETIVYATEANSDGSIPTTVGFQNITDGKVILSGSEQIGEPDVSTASTWNGVVMGAVLAE